MDLTDYIKVRQNKIFTEFSKLNVDSAIFLSTLNIFYLTGFNSLINSRPLAVIINHHGEVILLVPAIRYYHAKEEALNCKVKIYGEWGGIQGNYKSFHEGILSLLKDSQIVGVEDDIPLKEYRILSGFHTENISNLINEIRLLKDDYEISCIRKASKLATIGIETATKNINKGLSEEEICHSMIEEMLLYKRKYFSSDNIGGFGSNEMAQINTLDVWCLTNERISFGCDTPRNYIPKYGDIILPIVWARINGYGAEKERTLLLGDKHPFYFELKECLELARNEMLNVIKPGIYLSELYEVAENIIKESKYFLFKQKRFGHGIGLSFHEGPSISASSNYVLKENMVLTIEPGFMDISIGGVRSSDTILIKSTGYEIFT